MIEETAIRTALGEVIDPELGVPITELGLIYRVEIADGKASVEMTTTTPVCPLGSYLEGEIERRLLAVEGIEEVDVRQVFTPPWSPEMMTDTARRMLGWQV
ncbi:MAG: metal-sulfur cluster assembly factor [Acidimicrobiia bacterium]|nr:MAG: metal-sulfur cluster assembly factor [Acidimicrobiia bacterium]